MWPFKPKLRSTVKGVVASIRQGESRCRVTVVQGNIMHVYYVSEATVKLGKRVKPGTLLGYK